MPWYAPEWIPYTLPLRRLWKLYRNKVYIQENNAMNMKILPLHILPIKAKTLFIDPKMLIYLKS